MRGILYRLRRKAGNHVYILSGNKGHPSGRRHRFRCPDGKPPVVAYNGELYEDACVYALIKNTTGKIRVYKENIYEKTSAQSHFATKVDVSRKALIELDGKPAADVYSAELGIPVIKSLTTYWSILWDVRWAIKFLSLP